MTKLLAILTYPTGKEPIENIWMGGKKKKNRKPAESQRFLAFGLHQGHRETYCETGFDLALTGNKLKEDTSNQPIRRHIIKSIRRPHARIGWKGYRGCRPMNKGGNVGQTRWYFAPKNGWRKPQAASGLRVKTENLKASTETSTKSKTASTE